MYWQETVQGLEKIGWWRTDGTTPGSCLSSSPPSPRLACKRSFFSCKRSFFSWKNIFPLFSPAASESPLSVAVMAKPKDGDEVLRVLRWADHLLGKDGHPYGRQVVHLDGNVNVLSYRQSWKMSNLLHGPISTNQILPREKRINRNIFGTSNLQNRTYGVSCDE